MGNPDFQEHDFEPGIAPNGLFWTIAVQKGSVEADHGHGHARLRGHNVAVTDYHDIVNAIFGGGPTPLPSHVSFDVRWHGGNDHKQIRDARFGFAGVFVDGPATITDFNGVVGASEIRGNALGSDGSQWDFDTDMRFMQGQYIDTSARLRHGTFGFI